jgi:hypothetical protein
MVWKAPKKPKKGMGSKLPRMNSGGKKPKPKNNKGGY